MKLFKKQVWNEKEQYYQLSVVHKFISIFIIALGGGTIYLTPYLLYSFKSQIINVTQSNETEIQFLLTAYGILSLLLYIPGGWLADRVQAKTLFAFSMISTSIVTFWYSLVGFENIVNYSQLIIIHLLFALTTVLTFWSAFIKSVKLLGSNKEQTSLYSKAETTRYLLQVIFNYISVALGAILVVASPFVVFNVAGKPTDFSNLDIASSSSGIFFSLFFYAIVYLVCGILALIILPGPLYIKRKKLLENGKIQYYCVTKEKEYIFNNEQELKKYKKQAIKYFWKKVGVDTLSSLKSVNVILIGLLIFFTMNAYTVFSNYGTTFLESLGSKNKSLNSSLSVVYIYGIPILGALVAGFITAKWTKSTSKSIFIISIMMIVGSVLLLITLLSSYDSVKPSKGEKGQFNNYTLWFTFIWICFTMFFIGASRSIYWSTLTELKIKPQILGIAVGIISIIGFSKDVWAGILLSKLIENDFAKDPKTQELSKTIYELKALITLSIFAIFNTTLAAVTSIFIVIRRKK
ncbi:MFS transporter [Mesomycoplasma neurolyticum]|uniref:Putative permease n=1 Tax=Mesomycoplasma neurolyticum TaxID=2120 RepID=A0A449A5R4_9BACT|nr:MFS transporter [Mesomycoplasma neurolyticum]VEU59567.1 putative permease [Mesomycoplasma neurolyticum]